jgi:hypothetical protein
MLYVHLPLVDGESDLNGVALTPWTTVRICVRLDPVRKEWDGRTRADGLGEQVLASGFPDPELEVIAESAQEPLFINDDELGTMVLDRKMRDFVGASEVLGHECKISVHATPDDECDMESLRSAIGLVAGSVDVILEAIADEHFDLYTDWGSPIGPLDLKQFKLKPRLRSMKVSGDTIDLWFDDGGMFHGHLFNVGLVSGSVKWVSLAG